MTHPAREKELLAVLREHGADLPPDGPVPDEGPLIEPSRHVELSRALKARGWTLYLYCVASHWPLAKAKKADDADDPEHFQVAFGLRSVGAGTHVARWRVRIEAGETIATLVPLFAGADWQEREQYDLVGVVFAGHPDLRRLMLPEEWNGHPLRKDYAIETRHPPWR